MLFCNISLITAPRLFGYRQQYFSGIHKRLDVFCHHIIGSFSDKGSNFSPAFWRSTKLDQSRFYIRSKIRYFYWLIDIISKSNNKIAPSFFKFRRIQSFLPQFTKYGRNTGITIFCHMQQFQYISQSLVSGLRSSLSQLSQRTTTVQSSRIPKNKTISVHFYRNRFCLSRNTVISMDQSIKDCLTHSLHRIFKAIIPMTVFINNGFDSAVSPFQNNYTIIKIILIIVNNILIIESINQNLL